MLSRSIFAGCLLAVFSGSASAQFGESALDALNRMDAEEKAEQPVPSQDFDILDLPDDLFDRPAPSRPRRKLPPLELDRDWDYRFDVQYQSTINPYMRWYMRQNPASPRKRYLSKEYRAGHYGFHASAAGYSAYSLPVDDYGLTVSPYYQGQHGSIRYWDHLNWLFQQYSQTPIDRSVRTTGRPALDRESSLKNSMEQDEGIDPVLPDLFSQTKPTSMDSLRRQQIWVYRHEASGGISILYAKPAQSGSLKFHEAQAAITGPNNILALKWMTEPEWANQVELKAGKLKSMVQPSNDRVASAQ
ncbi:MAG: hypothetical protein ABJZ55_18915 [Fuerstiella sp.]